MFLAIADILDAHDAKALPMFLAIASDDRAPSKLRRNEIFTDDAWADLSGRQKQETQRNRALATRLLTVGAPSGDAIARVARCLAFSCCAGGLPAFHMLRFACGLPACFADLRDGKPRRPLFELHATEQRGLVRLGVRADRQPMGFCV